MRTSVALSRLFDHYQMDCCALIALKSSKTPEYISADKWMSCLSLSFPGRDIYGGHIFAF